MTTGIADAGLERATAAHQAGDLQTAEHAYRALAGSPRALHNLGVLYVQTARFDLAEEAFRQALALWPGADLSRYSLALQLLAQERYEEAWPLHEVRRRLPGLYIPNPASAAQEWRGEDLSGKRVIVFGEQGYGDQIQWARFANLLPAADVTYVCAPVVAPLFRRAGWGVIAADGRSPLPPADFSALAGSLPLRLGITADSLPGPTNLRIPLRGGGGIGVATRGKPAHPNDANRSLPPVEAARLLGIGRDLQPEATGAVDFLQTAEIIAGLDLVISVDTSVAHLAATLGVPTRVLLPFGWTDWRWLREREDSPWYPAARLYRQRQPGDWSETVGAVLADL
jgi:tetratricopeptide (TPR) repeat protein